jgi:hypothetical protein
MADRAGEISDWASTAKLYNILIVRIEAGPVAQAAGARISPAPHSFG